jgi:hypothetical protein
MNYTAIYEDPFDQDVTSEGGTSVTHEIRLRISSNTSMGDEEVKLALRCHLSERFKIAKINEEKIRIE